MRDFPSWAKLEIERVENDQSKTIDLSGLSHKEKLTYIPSRVFDLKHLEVLNLKNNLLTELPSQIVELKELRYINLSNNKIPQLNPNITLPPNLFVLDLSFNELGDLPNKISQLQNLTTLKLSGNRFKVIPDAISKLQNLTRFEIALNQLTRIPEWFVSLVNLKHLDLGSNDFSYIPDLIYQMPSLQKLYFCNYSNNTSAPYYKKNRIKELSPKIINLENLSELDLMGIEPNPIRVPPPEILSKGVEAIKDYLRQIESGGVDYLFEAKLLIVGEAAAGKTTLAKKIQNPKYSIKDEDSTEGIDVIRWNFPIDDERHFRVNIWDFGGQEIYHATHQFFLTKRSLYALVVDTRSEDTDLLLVECY